MKNAKDLFTGLIAPESFQRVASDHPLDLYCGLDQLGRTTLLLVNPSEPPTQASSNVIEVKVGRRAYDGKWTLSFTLLDNSFQELFHQFCDDLIVSSNALKHDAVGPKFICERYTSWQNMLSAENIDTLTKPRIKGLLGEMIFFRDVLIPKYGVEATLLAWMGPEMADQDFIFPNTWYEVKSITSGTEAVHISSIEQLDCVQEGTLVVLTLDPTSTIDKNGITLNSLFNELENIMPSEKLLNKFRTLLLKMNYFPRPEYDEYVYRFNGIKQYRVDKDFPSLRRRVVPPSVLNASWTLSLASVTNWLEV